MMSRMKRSSAPLVSSVPTTSTTGGPEVWVVTGSRLRRATSSSRVTPVETVRAAASMRAIGTGCDQRVGSVGLEMKIRTGPLSARAAVHRRYLPCGSCLDVGAEFAVEPDAEQALLQFAVGGKARRLDDAVDAAIDHDGDVAGHRRRHADILLDHEHRHVAILA